MNIQVTLLFPNVESLLKFFAQDVVSGPGKPAINVIPTSLSAPIGAEVTESKASGEDRPSATSAHTVAGTFVAGGTSTAMEAVPTPATGKKRGRKSNAEKAALAAVPAPSAATPAPEDPLAPVRDALRKLNDKKGVAACRRVMGEFSAQGVSQINVQNREAFIKRCADMQDAE